MFWIFFIQLICSFLFYWIYPKKIFRFYLLWGLFFFFIDYLYVGLLCLKLFFQNFWLQMTCDFLSFRILEDFILWNKPELCHSISRENNKSCIAFQLSTAVGEIYTEQIALEKIKWAFSFIWCNNKHFSWNDSFCCKK